MKSSTQIIMTNDSRVGACVQSSYCEKMNFVAKELNGF